MIDRKALRIAVTEVLKQNNFECSVCVQNIDTGITACSNLRGANVSWSRDGMMFFVPHETTFRIPYLEVQSLSYLGIKHLEIMLAGRNLLSIRETR